MGQFTSDPQVGGMGRGSGFMGEYLSSWAPHRHADVAEALESAPDSAFVVFEVTLDGDYDDGGAYWGGGQSLYCLRESEGNATEVFVRAWGVNEAIAEFRETLGPAFADVPVTVVEIRAEFPETYEEYEEDGEDEEDEEYEEDEEHEEDEEYEEDDSAQT